MMTFSGVLGWGGGGNPAPLTWLTCCKLEEDQNGAVILRSQTNMHDVVLEVTDERAVLK